MATTKQANLKTALCELPECVSEEDYRQCAGLLPPWRRREAEKYLLPSDRLQCAKAYLLLCRLIEEYTGKREMPEFGYGEYGKPFIKGQPRLHFNISHCARAVMCVVGDAPVGCDVEVIPQEADGDVMDLCFSPEERKRTAAAENPAAQFTATWTRKEALLKLRGTGLDGNVRDVLLSPIAEGVSFNTVVRAGRGYVYTTCVLEKEKCGGGNLQPHLK